MLLRRASCLAVIACIAVLTAGCDPATEPAARATAGAFADALVADNAAAACRLLAPGTKAELEQSSGNPCPAAILAEDLPAPGDMGDSASFGTMAKVTFAEDTVFVAAFRGVWKVVAAGCSPVPGHPYDCQLQGG